MANRIRPKLPIAAAGIDTVRSLFQHRGNLAWLEALAWRGHDAFNAAVERPFLSRDPLLSQEEAVLINAGGVRALENLVFLKVYNAGHMVPMHQPAVALDLINRFFANASFFG